MEGSVLQEPPALAHPDHLLTVRRIGYCFKLDVPRSARLAITPLPRASLIIQNRT